MVEWTDRAISLGLRRFGETGAILEVFARAHGRRRALVYGGSSQTKRAPMQPVGTAPRVIIVDDDRETREMLATLLRSEGFEVREAANGLKLISSLHADHPELILLDVNLSWIDGFELCRSVKSNEEFRNIPVVFLTGRTTDEDVKRGFEVGAVARGFELFRELLNRFGVGFLQRLHFAIEVPPQRPVFRNGRGEAVRCRKLLNQLLHEFTRVTLSRQPHKLHIWRCNFGCTSEHQLG